jgi:hypothetical protein
MNLKPVQFHLAVIVIGHSSSPVHSNQRQLAQKSYAKVAESGAGPQNSIIGKQIRVGWNVCFALSPSDG